MLHLRSCVLVLAHSALLLTAGVALAGSVIVDNTDGAFTQSGTWTSGSAANDYGTNYLFCPVSSGGATYGKWTPSIPCTGNYNVYAWWPTYTRPYTNAKYTVSYSGGSTTIYKNQTQSPGQWVLLGTWNFATGSTGYVQLNNNGSGSYNVAADAVKFEGATDLTLTMAATPGGYGSTSPAAGTHNQKLADVVYLTATPAPGYSFVQWTVSAGVSVGCATNPNTSVLMDVNKTVTAVFEPIGLTMAASPPGGGTTTPAVGGPYAEAANAVVSISATPAAGYVLSNWSVSAGASVDNPTAASTTLTMERSKTVTAVFAPIQLTMDVWPSEAGTTIPALGGPYAKGLNEVVPIQVTPSAGYTLDHWAVSGGSQVASPTSMSTSVTMDTPKTVTAVFKALDTNPPRFRAFWAAGVQHGYYSFEDVDTLVTYAAQGRYNVIVMEVLMYVDQNGTNSHGAFWKSNLVPRSPVVSTDFDPLAYMCQQAHAQNPPIEVDAWIFPFRCSGVWPPAGNPVVPSSGSWLMVPYANRGTVAKFDGTNYWLDAGSPDVQEYYASIVRELVTNYPIDGIHWDYEIGSSGQNSWYYADANYMNSGVARWKRIVQGLETTPPLDQATDPVTDDPSWADYRRRAVTELHMRCKGEIDAIATSTRRPIRHTDSTMAYDPVPACTDDGYKKSSAYIYFGDFATWLDNGYTDAAIPMVYKCGTGNSFTAWVDYFNTCFAYPASCPRPIYIGQGNYRLNPMSDSLAQMQYVYDNGMTGVCNYDYWYTLGNGSCNTGSNDTTWWDYMATNLYTSNAPIPRLTWSDPAVADKGILWGKVTRNGAAVDDATVTIDTSPPVTAQTDGNGYYILTMISADNYNVTAMQGTDSGSSAATVVAGDTRRLDLQIGPHRSITQWLSVKNHAGTDISIPLDAGAAAGNATVETRQGGIQKIQVVFSGTVSPGDPSAVTVTAGGTHYTPAVSVAGDTMTLAFSPALPSPGCYSITIGAAAISEILDGDADCVVRALVGDVTANGLVNLGDALYVRCSIGQPVSSYVAFDINLDGVIDSADVRAVKALAASPALSANCP